MKRHVRSLAITAPVLGLIVWLAFADMLPFNADSSDMSAGCSATEPDIGRTRELPASGPVAAPDGPSEMMMTLEHMRTMMPHFDHLIEQTRQ